MTIRKDFKRKVREYAQGRGISYQAALGEFESALGGSSVTPPPLEGPQEPPPPPPGWTRAQVRDVALALWNSKVIWPR